MTDDRQAKRLTRLSNYAWIVLPFILALPFVNSTVFYSGDVIGNRICDNPSYYYFANNFAAQSWSEGEIPLWNPYVQMGYPFHGEGQAGVFYPLSLIFRLFDTGLAINVFLACHFILSGLLFYGYLRTLGISIPSSLIAAVVLCFSSCFIGRFHAGHLNIVASITWGIGILYAWEKFFRSGSLIYLLLFSAFYSFLILAFYPLILLIFSLFIVLHVLLTIWWEARQDSNTASGKTGAFASLAYFALSMALGIGVSMISLLPAYEFSQNSFRQEVSYEFATMFSFAPENFLTLLCPYFFGGFVSNSAGPEIAPYFGRNYLWEMWVYIGVIPIALSFWGMIVAPTRIRVPLLSCMVIFLICALGKHTPVYWVFYEYVPFFSSFRGPSKYSLVVLVSLVVFAAYGMEDCVRQCSSEIQTTRRVSLNHLLVIILLCLLGLWLTFFADHSNPSGNWTGLLNWIQSRGETYVPPIDTTDVDVLTTTWSNTSRAIFKAIGLVLLFGTLILLSRKWQSERLCYVGILLLVAIDLVPFFFGFWITFEDDLVRYSRSLASQLQKDDDDFPPRILDYGSFANRTATYKVSNVTGYTGNTTSRYNDLVNIVMQRPLTRSAAAPSINRIPDEFSWLAVNYILDDVNHAAMSTEFVALGKYPIKRPRVFLAVEPDVVSVESRNYIGLNAVRQKVFGIQRDRIKFPVIENLRRKIPSHELSEAENVELKSFRNNEVVLKVVSDFERVLVLNEMNYKGWKAQVNGSETQVYMANYVFRSVIVPPGESTVRFYFDPASFRIGKYISIVSVVIWIAILGGVLCSRFRKSSSNDEEVGTGQS